MERNEIGIYIDDQVNYSPQIPNELGLYSSAFNYRKESDASYALDYRKGSDTSCINSKDLAFKYRKESDTSYLNSNHYFERKIVSVHQPIEERQEGILSKFKEIWRIGSDDNRLRFIDAIKLIASICLLTSSVISHSTQDWIFANSLLYPFRSQWGFIVFLVLIGRGYVSKFVTPQRSKNDHYQTGEGRKQEPFLEQSLVRQIGQSLLLRPFRFLLPILIVLILQRKVCQISPNFSEGLNAILPLSNSKGWCSSSQSDSIAIIAQLFSLFTVTNQSNQLEQETGMLYMAPLLFQASFYAIGISTFTHIFKTNSRTIFLLFLALVNWTTFSFLFPVILGIILTDLRISGKIDFLFSSTLIVRWSARLFLITLIAITLFIPQIREPLSNGLNMKGDYQMIKFSDCISATLFVLMIECFGIIFNLRFLAFLGKHLSASMVILHPLIIYGILPFIFKPTMEHSSSLLFQLWISTLFITMIFSIPFRILIEMVSILIGKLIVSLSTVY